MFTLKNTTLKTPFRHIIVTVFLLVLYSCAIANVPSDSEKRNEINGNAKVTKANVVYPPFLSGHEENSLEYTERFATNRRAYLMRIHSKGKKYFPLISAIFKKYNIPQEFKILIALESGFNGNAVSRAGAVGYWQIMAPVAREYGLRIANHKKRSKKSAKLIDERKNFHKSTNVAARYLKDRCRNLDNDYLLIVASYNWGVGNVWNAMQKTGKSDPTFWDIKKYLPSETKAYVMNFIAMNVIFHNYENFLNNTLVFKVDKKTQAEECEDECIEPADTKMQASL